MDTGTIIGLVLGVGLILFVMLSGGGAAVFVDSMSLMIVAGGTLAVTLVKFPLKNVLGSVKVAKNAFFSKLDAPSTMIDQLVEMTQKARREGLLALENMEITNEFLGKGVRLCVDGVDNNLVRKILDCQVAFTEARHRRGRDIFLAIGDSAPAFGMIGTLIGLIKMMMSMDDPSQIAPAMAIALLTTLYGALIANLFALPVAKKLQNRSEEEVLLMLLIQNGVQSLQDGDHPMIVQQKLQTLLEAKMTLDDGEAAAG